MDNHRSYLTYKFLDYCEDHNIIVFTFPPNTSHILQPLDGKPFQQYKHYYRKAVNTAARYGNTTFKKRDFLHALPRVRAEALKDRTIRAGFAKRGIQLFKPDLIIDDLQSQLPLIPDIEIHMGGYNTKGKKILTPPPPSSS